VGVNLWVNPGDDLRDNLGDNPGVNPAFAFPGRRKARLAEIDSAVNFRQLRGFGDRLLIHNRFCGTAGCGYDQPRSQRALLQRLLGH